MGESSQVPIPVLRKKKTLDPSVSHILLDSLPIAALIIDSGSWKILNANSAASQLTEIPESELSQLELFSLLSNWNSEFMDLLSGFQRNDKPRWNSPVDVELSRRNKPSINVQLQFTSLPGGEERVLILLEELNKKNIDSQPEIFQILDALNGLTKAENYSDLETALATTLRVGGGLTGAGILVIYLAHEGMPTFSKYIAHGDASLFPDQISDSDFEGLKGSDIWTTTNRPGSVFHRIARTGGFSYIATQILGEEHAAVGLLVIADQNKPKAGLIEETTALLASGITSLIQFFSRRNLLDSALSEQQMRNHIHTEISKTINEAVIVVDTRYLVQELNNAAEIILGYSPREARGQSIELILIGEHSFFSGLEESKNEGKEYSQENINLFRRNGEKFLATTRITPVKVDNQCQALVIVVKDLSEQEDLRNRAQQYEQQATLGEVTAMFTHEMRNMINNISTTLQLMQRQTPTNESHRTYIDQMLEECDRLNDQVTAVLAIAKPQKYELVPLDISELLRRLMDRYKARILKAKVESELITPPECPSILGNQYALEELFGNLISNAVDAMNETGGRLVIRVQPLTTQEGRSIIQIAVADTGPGIPPEYREKIFQRFFSTKQKGTGLGLAIIKGIVTAHKGNIRVEYYTPGTVFYIQLPVNK